MTLLHLPMTGLWARGWELEKHGDESVTCPQAPFRQLVCCKQPCQLQRGAAVLHQEWGGGGLAGGETAELAKSWLCAFSLPLTLMFFALGAIPS